MNLDLGSRDCNIKQSAYRQYLKSFSLNTMDTLKKLQRQFKDDISQNLLFQPNSMFKRVRTLLNSYEVMVLQINDSFQFIEVPQFGCCMLKVFLQMMSIIKWALKSIIARPVVAQQGQNNNNSNFEQIRKKSSFRTSSQNSKKQISENQKFKLKEQSKYIMQGLNYDMKGLQQKNNNFVVQQSLINNILSDKERVLKIQASQSQNILEQAVRNLSKKGQNIAQFIQMRQIYMKYCKQNAENYTMDAFQKLKQVTLLQSAQRSQKIKLRLNQLVSHCIYTYDKSRKQAMVSKCFQAHIKDTDPNKIRQQTRYIDRLKDNILALQEQLSCSKQMNSNLSELLQKKSEAYENQLMLFRTQSIHAKSRNNINLPNSNSSTLSKFNQVKQQRSRKQGQQKKLTIINAGTTSDQQSVSKYKRKLTKNRSKKSTKYIRSKKVLQEGFQEGQQIQSYDSPQNLLDRIVSLKSMRSCYSCKNFCLSFQSKVINFDYYPIHDRFRQIVSPGMLTTVSFDQLYKTKAIQTDKVRVLQYQRFLTLQPTVSIYYKTPKPSLRGSTVRNYSNLNECQTLLKINKPQTHRESAIKRIALNLTSRSSKQQKLIQIQRQNFKQNFNQKTLASTKRPISSVGTTQKSKFGTPLQNKNILRPYIISQDIKKIKVTCQLKQSIYFNKSDLLNLFLTEQNAKNYEYLNYSFNPIRQKSPKSKSKYLQYQGVQINYTDDLINNETISLRQKSKRFHQYVSHLVSCLLKQMKKYQKGHKNIATAIRSFIRYPYSFIKKSRQVQWQLYQKQEQEMQNWILNIHSKCLQQKGQSQVICHHIGKFYENVGIKML